MIIEQHVALLEQRRVRGIYVLAGIVGIQRSGRKGDRMTFPVMDRNHQTVVEDIADALFRQSGHVGLDDVLILISLPVQEVV